MLRNLASTGLIISSFAHELKSLAGILSSRTNDLSTVLHQYLTEEQMKGIIKFENPFYLLEIIQKEDRNIKSFIRSIQNQSKIITGSRITNNPLIARIS